MTKGQDLSHSDTPNRSRFEKDEARIAAAIGAPFAISRPLANSGPLIVAAPHSGRIYPRSWSKTLRRPLRDVRQAEDALVDQLIANAPLLGITGLQARFPRSLVDVNRARDALPPDMGGPNVSVPSRHQSRIEMGLGVIPTAIGQNMPLYSQNPSPAQAQARLKAFYDPYHNALTQLLDETQTQHGFAVLVDMHSMPSLKGRGGKQADFVIGDCFGRSCTPELAECVSDTLRALGYHVAYNHPYSGGYVTEHYGCPAKGREVLQIEINRELYLNPASMKAHSGFKALQSHIEHVLRAVLAHLSVRDNALAAE